MTLTDALTAAAFSRSGGGYVTVCVQVSLSPTSASVGVKVGPVAIGLPSSDQ